VSLSQYVKGISEKFRRIGNRFHVKTIFNTKHTLRGTLIKIGRVRDAQQMKQCVCITCDCGAYVTSAKKSRSLEARNKERKYNLTELLLEKKISPT
jgi:hypothetical protein